MAESINNFYLISLPENTTGESSRKSWVMSKKLLNVKKYSIISVTNYISVEFLLTSAGELYPQSTYKQLPQMCYFLAQIYSLNTH